MTRKIPRYPGSYLLVVLTVLFCRPIEAGSLENDRLLEGFSQKLSWAHHRVELERYRLAVTGHSDSLAYFEGMLTALLVDIDTSWKDVQEPPSDNDASRRLKMMLGRIGAFYRVEQSRAVSTLRDSLASTLAGFSGFSIFESVSQEERLRNLSEAGENADRVLRSLIKERNRLARAEGYPNYYALCADLAGMTVDEVTDLLLRIEKASDKPYADELKRRGDNSKPELWQVGQRAAVAAGKFDSFFPGERHIEQLRGVLSQIGVDLNALPIYIEETANSGDIFFVDPPSDIRILVDTSSGFQAFERAAELLSSAVASSMIDHDRGLFGILAEKPWQATVKRLLMRIYYLPQSLVAHSGMSDGGIRAFTDVGKRRDIIESRVRLVEAQFENRLYTNPDRNISSLYWSLCSDYLGVKRHDDLQVWKVSKTALLEPFSTMDNLLGEIAAAQIVSAMDRRSSHATVVPESSAYLAQNYFRFGSRYPWLELLTRGTDEKINPEYLLKTR